MVDNAHSATSQRDDALDVLIIGTGPTGLTLAAQLHTFSLRTRIIDRCTHPVRVRETNESWWPVAKHRRHALGWCW